MPARCSRTHNSAKILSIKRSSRVSFVSQCTTSLSECTVTGSIFGGAFISCSWAVTWVDGTGYVVSPIDGVNGVRRNLRAVGRRVSGARGRSGNAAGSLSTQNLPLAIRVLNRNRLFPLPRAFEQRHAGLETGCGDCPAEGARFLVQQPMHHHAMQHHHDRIGDVHGPAFIDTGAHEMGGVSFDLAPLRIRCDTLHPAAPVEQFIIAGVAGAELEMSRAGVLEVARFCEEGREALKRSEERRVG